METWKFQTGRINSQRRVAYHVTNGSTNNLVKLVGSNYFGNLPSFVSIIFFSTRMFCAPPTEIRFRRNDNFRHLKNLALQVGVFYLNFPVIRSSYFQLKVLI